MPTSTERGKGKGRGRKRKAAAAAEVSPVEPENCKTAGQPGSPMPTQISCTQSQKYIPRFTTKSKRSRVSSSEAVPVPHSQTLGTAEDAHEPGKERFQRRTKSSNPEPEIQAVEQVQQTVTDIPDIALHQFGSVCTSGQVEPQTQPDGTSCETSDSCEEFKSCACTCGSGISLVPGLALSQSNVSLSPVLQCYHSNSDVIPSAQDGLKADETANGLCEEEINRQEVCDSNEQIITSPIGQPGSPPVKIAAAYGQDGKNLELLDLMGSDDDTENEAIGCMEKATVEVGEPLCANAVDMAEEEAVKIAGGTSLQVGAVSEPTCDRSQTDFHVIDITSWGTVGDDAVPTPGQFAPSDALQMASSSPEAVLPGSQDHDLAQGAQESFYDGDGCGSQKKNDSITNTIDGKPSAGLTSRELNGSQSATLERQLSTSFENTIFSQQNELPSIVSSSATGIESYSKSLRSLAPLPTTDANSPPTTVLQVLPIEAPKFSTPCDTKIGVTMETVRAEWEESEASVAVQDLELMDIAAADLLESQLGCSGDEATVPSCSPASKKLPMSKPPSGCPPPLWLRRPGDITNGAVGSGTSGGVHSSSETDPGEGTGILCGLIEELSALNRFIMNCKRELDSARKQRSNWLKSQRGRRGR